MRNLNGRLTRLYEELVPARKIYQIHYVASEEEARRIAEEEEYEPWRPGNGIRFIVDESLSDWRTRYAELQE